MGMMNTNLTHEALAAALPAMMRPRLLVEAARIGARLQSRRGATQGPAAIARLLRSEEVCEVLRRERSPAYKPAQHVALLAAVMAAGEAQVKASASDALRRAT